MNFGLRNMEFSGLEFRRFIFFVFCIHFALIGILILEHNGVKFLFLRQIIAFFYLTFLPGIFILKLLDLNRINLENLIFSVALSLMFWMCNGLIINMLAIFFKIQNAFSIINLIIINSITLIILSGILLFKEKKNNKKFNEFSFNVGYDTVLNKHVLLTILIPFLSIFGTYLMNKYSNNLLLILMLLVLPSFFVLTYSKRNDKCAYPLFIFSFALTMLYYVSLITPYPIGRDIHLENYFIRQVISQGYWNLNIPHTYNAMLSDVIIGTFYSLFCDISSAMVLKIIYPALFSFVPLGLFLIWKAQTNEEMSLLSAILFISYFGFYFEITQVPRQEIAEIFLISFLLLLITKKTNNITKMKNALLIVIFLAGIAVSHYGTSYILILFLLGAYFVNALFKSTANRLNSHSALNLNLIIYTFTIALFWYIFIGGSTTFDALVNIFQQITSSLQEFLDPSEVEGLNFIVSQKSFTHNITKVLYLAVNFLISVGFFVSFKKDYLKRNFNLQLNFNHDYELFSICSYMVLVVSVTIPYTSTQIGTPRLYHIALIFLAPYFTVGFIFLIRVLSKKLANLNNLIKNEKFVILFFLFILFWFSTGLIYEIANDDPTSVSLNTSIVHPKFHFKQTEAFSSSWLSLNKKSNSFVYADENGRFILYDFIYDDYKNIKIFNNGTYEVDSCSYIFLNYLNVKFDEVVFMKRTPTDFYREYPPLKESPFYINFINKSNKIYDNSESEIYYLSGG